MNATLRQAGLILRLDLRLRWREARGSIGGRVAMGLLMGFLYLALHALAWPFLFLSRDHPMPTFETVGWLLVAFLAATAALANLRYDRDDSALLLASPLPPRSILLARVLSQAAAGVLPAAYFATPFFNVAVFVLGPRYLNCYLVLVAVAIVASSAAFALTLALSRRFGPKRVLLLIRVFGALLGVGFAFLGQLPSLLGKAGMARVSEQLPPISEWPVLAQLTRAGHGAPLDLASVVTLAVLALAAVGYTCGDALLHGIQAGHESAPRRKRVGEHRWTESLALATYRKELRVLARDPLVLVQMLVAVGPVLPIAIGWRDLGWAMAGLFACFLAQLGGAQLVQATTSQERCWDLIRGSPTFEPKLRVAKLLAGLTLPLALAGLLCLALAVAGRPWLALVTFLVSGGGALAIGWMFVSRIRPMAAPTARVVRPKFESAALGPLLVSLLVVGPSLGGIAAAAAGRTWLAAGLLGAAALVSFLIVAFTQMREIEDWRFEALRHASASK